MAAPEYGIRFWLLPGSPPIVPGDEEVVVQGDPPFIDECRRRVAEMAEKQGYRFGNCLTTRSKLWGFVWRIDYRGPEWQDFTGGPAPRPRRYVFWEIPEGRNKGIASWSTGGVDFPPL